MIIARVFYGNTHERVVPEYTFEGPTEPEAFYDEDGNWEIVFTESGKITFTRLDTNVDIFVCDGGSLGKPGAGNLTSATLSYAGGGDGGRGGARATKLNQALQIGKKYSVKVGKGQTRSEADVESSGFGVDTSFPGITRPGGAGGDGAVHQHNWYGSSVRQNGTAGADGEYAFGASTSLYASGRKYGGGGGGGGAYSTYMGVRGLPGAGGQSGGGAGGNTLDADWEGHPGAANTGGGGGGGGSLHVNTNGQNDDRGGGFGGSGIVIIRNTREENT